MGKKGKKAGFMNTIVLDTDLFIDLLRGFEKAIEYFERLREEDYIIYFSAITEIELISGKECNKIENLNHILCLQHLYFILPLKMPIIRPYN